MLAVDKLLDALVAFKACSAWDDVSHDDVLFEAQQVVGFAGTGSFGQNTRCVLEGGGRNKGLGAQAKPW